MVPSFFLLSALLLCTGVAGQPWVHSIWIEAVDDSRLVLQPGENRTVRCIIKIEQSIDDPLIEFYGTDYRRIMTKMDPAIEDSYGCEENSTLTKCHRVAVISSSLKDQNIQCAFHVGDNSFYSQTFTVLVEEVEATTLTKTVSSTLPTPSPTEPSPNYPQDSSCDCPTPTIAICEGSTSDVDSVSGSAAQFLFLLLIICFTMLHLP